MIGADQLQDLIAGGESLTVEFKSDRRQISDKEIYEEIVSLANSPGGTLLIGVEDGGEVTGAVPRHGTSTDPLRLQAAIFGNTVPSINTRVSVLRMDDREVLAIEVDRYASPLFPRLLNGDLIRDTIARGVSNSILAYVGKAAAGKYEPFLFGASMSPQEVEISDDVFVITAEKAEAYRQALGKTPAPTGAGPLFGDDGSAAEFGGTEGTGQTGTAVEKKLEAAPASDRSRVLTWSGEVPAQKWMNFYTKVLAKFATSKGLRLTVKVEAAPESGVSKQVVEETKAALRELNLHEDVKTAN